MFYGLNSFFYLKFFYLKYKTFSPFFGRKLYIKTQTCGNHQHWAGVCHLTPSLLVFPRWSTRPADEYPTTRFTRSRSADASTGWTTSSSRPPASSSTTSGASGAIQETLLMQIDSQITSTPIGISFTFHPWTRYCNNDLDGHYVCESVCVCVLMW